MRIIVALPLLLAAACGVENDPRNDTLTLEYDEQAIENTTESVGNAAEQAASDLGNAAESAGDTIQNEVGDVDVDLDVNRNRPGDAN